LKFPKNISEFKNLIVYGPPGVGKYTQVLAILKQYSPSKLKYDKKISIAYEKQEKKKTTIPTNTNTTTAIPKTKVSEGSESTTTKKTLKKKNTPLSSESTSAAVNQIKKQDKKQDKKQEYTYRISDIHYEIDMSTLGCNSKLLWHDLFFQIIDIISMSNKSDKIGIIVCKNFHTIHNELLDIFYSYIRHPLYQLNIHVKFILITENIGFIPCNIVQACAILPVVRPDKNNYIKIMHSQTKPFSCFSAIQSKTNSSSPIDIIDEIDITTITNSKEIHSFSLFKKIEDIPVDLFNIISDKIIEQILSEKNLNIIEFRSNLYDLLIYNVDIYECIWYIFTNLIKKEYFQDRLSITDTFNKIFVFFKYYNNNYRSIYHLESILLCMLNKIHFTK
jgi:hypothetical protein